MIRVISKSMLWALLVSCLPAVAGCGSNAALPSSEVAESGRVGLPLRAVVGDQTYRLSAVSLLILPTYFWLSSSDGANETELATSLAPGEYEVELYDGWFLEREISPGRFAPVEARLASSPVVGFSVFNGTTTTISFEFETDGQLVTLGSGDLRVAVDVVETEPACTILGDDCPEGSWCAPGELTASPLACIPAGNVAVGEDCASPLDCEADSTCLAFGDAVTCTALCTSDSFGLPCTSGGICRPRGADYGACIPETPRGTPCPLTTRLLPISDRRDAIYDSEHCAIYVSTWNGALVRHDLWTHETRTWLALGGDPAGMDLSPNGNLLLVADTTTSSSTTSRVVLVDLESESTREVRFTKNYYEGGTLTPAFLDDTSALVSSSSWAGFATPLRRLDVAGGAYSELASYRYQAVLAASADRSAVAYVEPSGSVGRYLALDASVSGAPTSGSPVEVAVNRDGSEIAVPRYDGVGVYHAGSTFEQIRSRSRYSAMGAVYSPDSDVLYVSFFDFSGPGSVEALDATTLETIATIDSNPGFSWGGGALDSGRLRISPDGRQLLATTTEGVELYAVE